jgi:hypothetical protein
LATFSGTCDASAAAPLAGSRFVVGNDEDNVLRIYDADRPGAPAGSLDVSTFLEVDRRFPEADIEGAARVGNRIYWITSHGESRSGEARGSRQRFFATDLVEDGSSIRVTGRPFRGLVDALDSAPGLQEFRLGEAAKLPPRAPGALNIEGLCAMPDGRLLIGFRNPIPSRRALLVPLQNPAELLDGGQPRFDPPVLLDLGGLGVREIVQQGGRYLIVAGAYDGGGKVRLFEWDGTQAPPVRFEKIKAKEFNPEAVVFPSGGGWDRFLVLSDDGGARQDGRRCKDLPRSQRSFRAMWVPGG